MKKLLLFCSVALIAISLNAQVLKVGKFDIGYLYAGPKFGLNTSINSIDAPTGSSKTLNAGFQLGGVAKIGLTKALSFQPELMFISKGTGSSNDFGSSKENYHYIGIPLIVKYAFLKLGDMRIYGEGGFYTDVIVSSSSRYSNEFESFTEYGLYTDHYKRIDSGFNIGGGFEMPFYNNLLAVELRYSQGVIDVYKNDAFNTSTDLNTSFQISATYLFDVINLFIKDKSNVNVDDYNIE